MLQKTSIRCAYKSKFTVISNNLAQNNNLSLKARGLMCYFLSLPDDWVIYVDQLSKVLKEKRHSILSALKELKKEGYIHHTKLGYKDGWQYFTFGDPITEDEFKLFLRTNRFSNSSKNEQFGKQQLQNTHPKEILNTHKNKEIVPSKEVAPSVSELAQHLFLKYNLFRKSLNLEACSETIITKNWTSELAILLKTYSKERLIELINFTFEDDFWKKVIESPAGLRKNIKKLETQQAQTKKVSYSTEDNQKYGKFLERKSKDKDWSGTGKCQINALDKYLEIVFLGCQKQPLSLRYDTQDFKTKLDECLKRYNLLT